MSKQRIALQNILICRFGGVLLIGIIILIAVGLASMTAFIPNKTDKVKDTLQKNEEDGLNVRTRNLAIRTEKFFNQIINDMESIKNYSDMIYNNQFNIKSYYDVNFYTHTPSNPFDSSVWFSKYTSDPNDFIDLANSSIHDNVFRPKFRANPLYQGIYIGFEYGVWYHHPYIDLSSLPNLNYVCVKNNLQTIGYDPTCRGWYQDAKNNPNSIVISPPYIDASTSQVLITASTLIGNRVIGSDIIMDIVSDSILNAGIVGSGYAYMINRDGNAIVYPNLSRDKVYSVLNLEFSNSVEQFDFTSIINSMMSGENGQSYFIKSDSRWLITYHPVNGTDYVVAIVVPEHDIIAPGQAIEDDSNSIITGGIIGTVFAGILLLVSTIYISKICSDNFISDITGAKSSMQMITQGRLDDVTGVRDPKSQETEILSREMQYLAEVIKISNDAYYGGDPSRALIGNQKVEEIMKKCGNNSGLVVTYNNIGNILKDMDKMNNAENYLKNAIAEIENIRLKIDPKDVTAYAFYTIREAAIRDNYGLWFSKQNLFEEATMYHLEAMNLHRKADNKLGELHAMGNLGLAYMKMGKPQEAELLLIEAYNTAVDQWKNNKTLLNTRCVQYSSKNLALHYQNMSKAERDQVNRQSFADRALQHFQCALQISNVADTSLQNQCLNGMIEIYQEFYGHEGNRLAELMKKDLKFRSNIHVAFALDVSGSMAGSQITTCREAILNSITNHLDDSDYVSLITFNNVSRTIFKNLKKGDNLRNIQNHVNNNTQTSATTAFYNAIIDASKIIDENTIPNGNQWIVALTDGNDNESRKNGNTPEYVRDFCRKKKINLIIITVGNVDMNPINTILSCSNNGLHIPAHNTSKIAEAFGNAMQVVMSGHTTQLTL